MEQLTIQIPYEFISRLVRLNWRQLKAGIDDRIISPDSAIDLATELLSEGDDSSLVLDLACSTKGEPTGVHVDRLSRGSEGVAADELRRLWAYLVLAWVFEHRNEFRDPLEVVEQVYADFDYPEQVASFVRYMPTSEPDLGAPALNEARLFAKWEEYLGAENRYFSRVR